MVDFPSLIGYRPEEAEAIAAEHGIAITWVEAMPPRWLSSQHEGRVGRQRQLADGTVELLRVLVPVLRDGEDQAVDEA